MADGAIARRVAQGAAVVAGGLLALGTCGVDEPISRVTEWVRMVYEAGMRTAAIPAMKRPPVSLPATGARYVVFESSDMRIVPGDTNHATDIFFYDRETALTLRVSVGRGGAQANGGSFTPEVSADGRIVVFESLATNLVPDDTNRQRDVFVHDRQERTTTRVSVDDKGNQADNFSQAAHLSEDGRFIVFESLAANLVPDDTNGVIDVFVHDRQTKRTTRVSVASDGTQANNASVNPTISTKGRYVTFDSFASNLLPGGSDGTRRTLVHDRRTGETVAAVKREEENADSAGERIQSVHIRER